MDGGTTFGLWAPAASQVEVVLEARDGEDSRRAALSSEGDGFFYVHLTGVGEGHLYRFAVDGRPPMPDPRSRYAPRGVFGPSCVVDPARYRWRDGNWRGRALRDLTIYELHVGTFTAAGTFAGVIEKLPELRRLGVGAIELLPVHDFPGRWNWGYDPGAFFAPSRAYGPPDALRALVDAAHGAGIAVLLDVVYNHLGPDGAYPPAYCPFFFTDRHRSAWGASINFDGPQSAPIRAFFIDNACAWLQEYHIDGLRLDATAAIVDDSSPHLLTELAAAVAELPGPPRLLIAEDSRNFAPLLEPREEGGMGLDGVWVDDFHHQIRCALTLEQESYYQDYPTDLRELPRSVREGWLYSGQISQFLGAPRGTPAPVLQAEQSVICIQNHDQVGNRARGERLHHQIDSAAYRAASALLLWLPQTPMLFAGQEWSASAPFQFFTDHRPQLGRQVTAGRKAEFAGFASFSGTVPDPQAEQTYLRSKLDWEERQKPEHATVLQLYTDLLAQRSQWRLPASAWRCVAQAEGILVWEVLTRYVVICLRPAARLELPADCTLEWHTEQPAYSRRPLPPKLRASKAPGRRQLDLRTFCAALLQRPDGAPPPHILEVAAACPPQT